MGTLVGQVAGQGQLQEKLTRAFGPLLSVVRINYVKHVPKDSHNQKEFFFSFFGCEPSSKIKNHGGPWQIISVFVFVRRDNRYLQQTIINSYTFHEI